jgi:hypothetical protein
MASGFGATEAAIVIGKLDVFVWAVGEVASVTLMATADVPTEVCAGVPEIVPVEPLMDNPLGRPVALNR